VHFTEPSHAAHRARGAAQALFGPPGWASLLGTRLGYDKKSGLVLGHGAMGCMVIFSFALMADEVYT